MHDVTCLQNGVQATEKPTNKAFIRFMYIKGILLETVGKDGKILYFYNL